MMFSFRRAIDYSTDSAKAVLSDSTLQKLRAVKRSVSGPMSAEEVAPIRDIAPVKMRRSDMPEPRINLLIPSIRKEHSYGGVSTALKFFEELSHFYRNARLVLTGATPRTKDIDSFAGYRLVSAGDSGNFTKEIVSVADRNNSLEVGPGDLFVSTIWYTAYIAQRLVFEQSQEFEQPVKPLVYFIQDYEPGFYPLSGEYLLARSTYEYEGPMVAVFNTDLLRQYFHAHNYGFDREYSFEPQMNKVLRDLRPDVKNANVKKCRQILVYGRPSTPRNAFGLVVEALRIWRDNFPQSSAWRVLSVGEHHRDVAFGKGMKVQALGKLSLEAYARALSESSVGLSFMVSPHPSYPPLEMAHYGMWVLTNSYANKNLSSWHDNIVSLDNCSPERVSHSLAELCRRVESDPTSGLRGLSHIQSYLADNPPFPFVEEIRKYLQDYDG